MAASTRASVSARVVRCMRWSQPTEMRPTESPVVPRSRVCMGCLLGNIQPQRTRRTQRRLDGGFSSLPVVVYTRGGGRSNGGEEKHLRGFGKPWRSGGGGGEGVFDGVGGVCYTGRGMIVARPRSRMKRFSIRSSRRCRGSCGGGPRPGRQRRRIGRAGAGDGGGGSRRGGRAADDWQSGGGVLLRR